MQQIHLAGHASEVDEKGRPLLIDTHDRHVDDIVWDLFARVVRRMGAVPTLIEWDANIPDWPTLEAEAARADIIMQTAVRPASVDRLTPAARIAVSPF
ncbi:MAG TPA: DUF692 family protein [Paraburkholderia sp.]|nr:DUF692 family protein [Paraburkholderia sp.]